MYKCRPARDWIMLFLVIGRRGKVLSKFLWLNYCDTFLLVAYLYLPLPTLVEKPNFHVLKFELYLLYARNV